MLIQPGWQGRAKCAGLGQKDLPPEEQKEDVRTEADKLFFVGQGGKSTAARHFCLGCPVRRDCLHYAVLYDKDGMWGGTSKQERSNYSPSLKLALMQEALDTGRLEVHDIDAYLEVIKINGEQGIDVITSGNLTVTVDDYVDSTLSWLRNLDDSLSL